ncbi:haloalkane dehalogenase family protein [Glonium stellatum]|uniref:Haloalkane dehalogenase family protein n=1 Tax=Glonium stellatum TaxID=574774 RepID=A0A8E2F936_9PEZI|nr:haloalkane dehalogenase family protein [Glonium stellatum]
MRLWTAIFVLLPLYLFTKVLSVAPHALANAILLLRGSSRKHLIQQSDIYRRGEEFVANQQLNGAFHFEETQIRSVIRYAIQREARWFPNIEHYRVCGARVNVVHEKPLNTTPNGQTVVLLHGNPSWSYMWRDIIPILTREGHEVFALDWIGHGLSDKPTDPTIISFELHMRTLLALFEHFDIRDCCIVAHDWGGCVVTACGPYMPLFTNPRIFLLNSFMPPRPYDIGLNCYALYMLWFLCTGIFNGFIPEWVVMRYMAPLITADVARGYEAPYIHQAVEIKASISRFAHIVPGFPDWFLDNLRNSKYWRLFEGLCGPAKFTNFNAQAQLAERGHTVRRFWKSCSAGGWRAAVVFGNEDPLLRDFKGVLEDTIDKNAQVSIAGNGWIAGVGHYPVEERPNTLKILSMSRREEGLTENPQ